MWKNRQQFPPFPNSPQNRGIKRRFPEENVDAFEAIEQICNSKTTVEEQISEIIEYIQVEPKYYEHINTIQKCLKASLDYFYKGKYKGIYMFGSAVMKLALKNSDVDFFVEFDESIDFTNKTFPRILKNKIWKNRSFNNVIAIPAKVPIVKCLHTRTGINCDISFLNGLVVDSSNLVTFFLSLDDRIRILILLLKFSIKEEGISKLHSFTSYALINLVIYFLQQLEEPLIPPVRLLQEKATTEKIVGGWNVSYSTTDLPPITNTSSVVELMHQFFKFYAAFEFGFYVISPYTGKTYLKSFFKDVESLPNEFSRYKENVKKQLKPPFDCNKVACIQGFFNHSHNVTCNIPPKNIQDFQDYCAEKMLIPCQTAEDKCEYLKKLFKRDASKNLKVKEFETEVGLTVKVGIDLTNPNATEDELRKRWCDSMVEKIKDALIKVMKCIVSSSKDSHSDPNVIEVLDCELKCFELVSKKRRKIRENLNIPPNLARIEQEEIISNEILDNFIVENSVSYKFQLKCFVKKGPTTLCVQLVSKEQTKERRHFVQQISHFIFESLPKLVNE